MKDKFKFNKDGHSYTLNGKLLTGCTTILGVVAKPFLIPWAAKMTTEYIRENAGKFDLTDPKQFEQLLLEAKLAHTKSKEKAGDYGTEMHAEIEKWIKSCIKNKKYKAKSKNPAVKKGLEDFLVWTTKNDVRFLESEKKIYSKKYWLGGTLDIMAKLGKKTWIIDVKTAKSGLYAENFWQMAGYELMLKESTKYKKIDGYILLNLKENGEFIEKRSISNQEHIKAFLACLEIYRQKEKTNNIIK